MPVDWEESTTYRWIFQKGFAQGLAQVAEEYTSQGRSEVAKRMLSKLANKKFGAAPDAESTLFGIDDRVRLERMADRIFEATDWNDLLSTP